MAGSVWVDTLGGIVLVRPHAAGLAVACRLAQLLGKKPEEKRSSALGFGHYWRVATV